MSITWGEISKVREIFEADPSKQWTLTDLHEKLQMSHRDILYSLDLLTGEKYVYMRSLGGIDTYFHISRKDDIDRQLHVGNYR